MIACNKSRFFSYFLSSTQGYSGDPLPVLVFIHGGGFTGGSNLFDVGHFLAAQDVVVVMPNYRVGIFG